MVSVFYVVLRDPNGLSNFSNITSNNCRTSLHNHH